jgi:hypothetical protein
MKKCAQLNAHQFYSPSRLLPRLDGFFIHGWMWMMVDEWMMDRVASGGRPPEAPTDPNVRN